MKMQKLIDIVTVTVLYCHWVYGNLQTEETTDVISSIQEQDLVNEEAKEENATGRTKPGINTPEYLNLLLGALEENFVSTPLSAFHTPLNGQDQSSHRDRLSWAWTSADCKVDIDDHNKTTVIFQQNFALEMYGEFTSSQITLTRRDDAEVTSNAFLTMYTQWQNHTQQVQLEIAKTTPILPGKRFYSFSIMDFISSSLKANLSTPNFIRISFLLSAIPHGGQIFDFGRNFDLQVELPTIYFYYRGFLPPPDIKAFHNIRKRSVPTPATRPSGRCQRRELFVDPAQVSWTDVIQPKLLDLGFCSGSCPFPLQESGYNFTLHSFLLDRYRINVTFENLPTGFPHSCCIPLRYKPLSIIEVLDSADVYQASVVENISVDICGCR